MPTTYPAVAKMPRVGPFYRKIPVRTPFRPASPLAASTLPRNWIIKRMPADIWRLIFNASVANDIQNGPFSLRNAPILLSHVCST